MRPGRAFAHTSAAFLPRRAFAALRQRLWRLAPADREPVILRHRRIYILPTRRGAMLIATLVLMLLTAVNYALSLGYAFTFLSAGLMAASLLQTFRNLSGMALKPLSAGTAFAGDHLAFHLALSNAARTPRTAIVITTSDGQRTTIDAPVGGVLPVIVQKKAPARGLLALGRITIVSDFPLGLWRAWAYVHFPLQGLVYPAPESDAPPLPSGDAGDRLAMRHKGAEAELSGVREYRAGDPIHRIAWKAVARGTGWYTKAFDGRGGEGQVALEWQALPATLSIEHRLSRLTAWVLAADRAGVSFSLALPDTMLPVNTGATQRGKALNALALYGISEPR